jgi:hypothetical protein
VLKLPIQNTNQAKSIQNVESKCWRSKLVYLLNNIINVYYIVNHGYNKWFICKWKINK